MYKQVVIFLALMITCFSGLAQTPETAAKPEKKISKVPPRYVTAASGQEMFKAYCASCHGNDGKGNGPVATALKVSIPDLTELSASNKGSFPRDHVVSVIQGRTVTPAHGSADMPVWGPVFLSLDKQSEAIVQQRASNLATYIESLQSKQK